MSTPIRVAFAFAHLFEEFHASSPMLVEINDGANRALACVETYSVPHMMTDPNSSKHDQRSVSIFAKSIYRELRSSGFSESDVMALAGELLALLTRDVRSQGFERPTG